VEQKNKILMHACCGICSGYPISLLQDMGYQVIVYFYNPNIHPAEEYQKRLEGQKIICKNFNCKLIEGEFNPNDFYNVTAGLENEPEKGKRCDKCFELRLNNTAQKAKELNIENFTTAIVVSPHKNFKKITEIGKRIAKEAGLNYMDIDFKKQDGFLKTNKISKSLNIYRQNYCGCKT